MWRLEKATVTGEIRGRSLVIGHIDGTAEQARHPPAEVGLPCSRGSSLVSARDARQQAQGAQPVSLLEFDAHLPLETGQLLRGRPAFRDVPSDLDDPANVNRYFPRISAIRSSSIPLDLASLFRRFRGVGQGRSLSSAILRGAPASGIPANPTGAPLALLYGKRPTFPEIVRWVRVR